MELLSEITHAAVRLADLPAANRAQAARALAPRIDRLLADRDVAPDTAQALWTRLHRAIDPTVSAEQDPDDARAAARAALGLGDAPTLDEVVVAGAADRRARADADQARTRLRSACARAAEAGLPTTTIARAAGVSREALYQWLGR